MSSADSAAAADAPRAATNLGATKQLARFAAATDLGDLPPEVREQGIRAFVNWAGCVLGATHHEAVVKVRHALAAYSQPPEATVLGTGARFNMMQAALFNSMAASVRVFEDTYLSATVHPTSPVAAAALAVAEHCHASGEAFLAALILGDEITCRAGNILTRSPARSHLGLYMTGIAGGIGAAVAAAKLMRLAEREIAWAIGIAVLHAAGVRALHGNHSTYMMAGNAAHAGVIAAILARDGVSSSESVLEAPRGFGDVFASPPNMEAATDGLGKTFEILDLTFKPYPCGVVAHAGIDACLQLARERDIDPSAIERVDIEICKAGVELTGLRHPQDHMACRNSLHHWCAVALLFRRATISEEGCIDDPKVVAVRDRIFATSVPDLPADAARVRVVLRDGSVLERVVDHCVGSRDRPMTDAEIDEKFLGQARLVMSEGRSHDALATCREIASTGDIAAVVGRLVGDVRPRGSPPGAHDADGG
jgi:2-methylcitrate dehydratase PrpD